MTQAVELF